MILHNMIVVQQRNNYESNIYLDECLRRRASQGEAGDPVDLQLINLFGVGGDGGGGGAVVLDHLNDEPNVDDIFAARAANVDADLRHANQHMALMYDLMEDIWKKKQARDNDNGNN